MTLRILSEAPHPPPGRSPLSPRRHHRGLRRLEEALTAYEQAAEANPDLAEALAGITQGTARQLAAKSIGTSSQPITLRFQNAKLKEVFEMVARSTGLNAIFDKEARGTTGLSSQRRPTIHAVAWSAHARRCTNIAIGLGHEPGRRPGWAAARQQHPTRSL
ncbi:MAG: hypothetical protein Q7U76_12635 [Nitrospirota bacterium]|nr:hypothetical protein [Nitrospirota bacterium]